MQVPEKALDTLELQFSEGSLHVLTACLALIMFGVALHLRPADFRRIAQQPRGAIAGLVSQFLVLPALTVLLINLWQPEPSLALGMLLVACCPGGTMSNFLSLMARANVALSVGLTAISSILALVLTPLNFLFWRQGIRGASSLYRPIEIDGWNMALSVGLMLVIPLFLGMLVQGRAPDLAARLRKPLNRLSLLIFFGFLLAAFLSNTRIFLDWFRVVFLLVAVHNGLAFAGGYATAWLARLPEPDRRTLTIETGIQNSGLALVLVFAHFEGRGGMALVAGWWGIWHLVSGMALARYFGRKAANN